MKTWLIIIAGALGVFWFMRRRQQAAADTSLREDKPAPKVPRSVDLVKNSPLVDTLFNLPTVLIGRAPAPSWAGNWEYEDVANIYRSNADGFNKAGTEGGHA